MSYEKSSRENMSRKSQSNWWAAGGSLTALSEVAIIIDGIGPKRTSSMYLHTYMQPADRLPRQEIFFF